MDIFSKKLLVGSYSGLLQMWDYETRKVVASKKFDKGCLIQCATIDPQGHFVGKFIQQISYQNRALANYTSCLAFS